MAIPPPRRHLLRRARVPLRLGSIVVACAVVAGVSAVNGAVPQALAASDTVRTSGREAPNATREAIDSSTASVATTAVVASPAVSSLPTTATTSANLPAVALNAYERAAQVINSVRPGCHLAWPVLAAIGQVESDHGRSAGSDLQIDGTGTTPVRGAVLDGSRSTVRVADTDGGQLDGTSAWDRAVGPMQFLPSTWINVRVDGDGDGIRSPDDIDDASLAAGVFLCAWDDDLTVSSSAAKAVGHFNNTPGYARTVLALARTYGSDSYLANIWTGPLVQASVNTLEAAPETEAPTTSAAEDVLHPVVEATKTSATPSPAAAVKASPSPSATTTATPVATPVGEAPVVSTPTPTPPTLSTPTPMPTPTPPPIPMPTPIASPTTTPTLAPTTLSGTLTTCGDREFCLNDQAVDFGVLDEVAASDVDGDGTVESKLAELSGLLGMEVTVTVRSEDVANVVSTIDGWPWQYVPAVTP